MIYNDGDGDNDAYDDDRDDDEREISWYYETTRWHSKDPPDMFGDELRKKMGNGFALCRKSENTGGSSIFKVFKGVKRTVPDEAGKIIRMRNNDSGASRLQYFTSLLVLGLLRTLLEQRIAAMMGYRGGSGG
ncbi:hypothetical protein Tco_0138724 [Tanacetum coccineum]